MEFTSDGSGIVAPENLGLRVLEMPWKNEGLLNNHVEQGFSSLFVNFFAYLMSFQNWPK